MVRSMREREAARRAARRALEERYDAARRAREEEAAAAAAAAEDRCRVVGWAGWWGWEDVRFYLEGGLWRRSSSHPLEMDFRVMRIVLRVDRGAVGSMECEL